MQFLSVMPTGITLHTGLILFCVRLSRHFCPDSHIRIRYLANITHTKRKHLVHCADYLCETAHRFFHFWGRGYYVLTPPPRCWGSDVPCYFVPPSQDTCAASEKWNKWRSFRTNEQVNSLNLFLNCKTYVRRMGQWKWSSKHSKITALV